MNYHTLGPAAGSGRSRDQHPVCDWDSLERGNRVEVRFIDSFPYTAYVDERDDDGHLLWLIENGTGSRRLFLHDDPVTLYLI
ncbi:hypothetical protein [Arthrobacter sp. fls2-241-R2A-200]|uniref:hypothetical protein n=1 Tax=Arthrobacter sp. fls2-241-R2A-200 TaxID=3040281 RepID=UPI00254C169E|nr:hypothetical protein [Arthrobacter sp. fls2-241-R2A-200]